MNNKIKNIIIFLLIVLIFSIIFKEFLNMHYATDTYNIMDRGYEEYAIKYSLNDGRLFMSIISLIANYFNISIKVYIITLTFLAIVVSCISVMLLKNIIEKYKRADNIFEEIVLILICCCSIFNFMFLENMQFAECFVMSISILLYIVCANILTDQKPKYLSKTIICATFAILFYQGTLGYFVVMTLVFSIIKDRKKLIKNLFGCVSICIITVIINLVQIKISGILLGMNQARMGSILYIPYMIGDILYSLPYIFINTMDIFPKYMYSIYISILIVLIIINQKNRKINIINVLVLIYISIGSALAISLFTAASFPSARMMFPLGALIGNMFIILYVTTDIFRNNMKNVLLIVLISYFFITILNYTSIIKKHEKVNKLTIEECNIIREFISEYEGNTGFELKNIAVYYDSKATYFYEQINNYSILCIRPLSVEWGDNGAINYWCDIKLKEIEQEESIYNIYFKDKNWDSLNKEQFVFIGDTLHYCVY